MGSTIIASIITGVCSIICIGFTGTITYLVARSNLSKPASRNILEEQYIKVIAPLKQTLSIGMFDKNTYPVISDIMYNNFYLLPDDHFKAIENHFLSSSQTSINIENTVFVKNINIYFKAARTRLGYSQIQLSEDEKNIAKFLLPESFDLTFSFGPFYLMLKPLKRKDSL